MNRYVVLQILVTQIMIVLVYFLFWDLLMDLLLVMDLITIRKGYLSFFLCLYLMDNMDGLLLIFFVFFYILFVLRGRLRSLNLKVLPSFIRFI